MQKSLTLLVLLAALVMSACQPTANSTPSLTAELIPTTAATATVAVPVTPTELTSPDPVPTTAEVSGVVEGCTVVSQGNQPTPVSPFRAIDETDWAFGSETARVTIIEYSDFQCPYCALLTPVLNQLKEDFQDDLRIIFRHFPLSIHDKALLSAYAAEAAGVQEKFWEMHDQLFERQAEWSSLSLEAFRTWLLDLAAELGLDVNAFEADLDNADVQWRVQRDLDEAMSLGIPGTPTLAINGQYYDGPTDFVNLSAIVNLIKLEDIQFSECPPMTIDLGKQYRATLKTEKGDIVIELLAEQAPIAVNNFVFLSENNWYDGVTFHRVLPGIVAQAGDPTGTGFGGPGYAFKNEIAPGVTFDDAGIVGMANAGADSNGSQFFITYAPQSQLDGGYTIFGRVIAGMDVLVELTPRDPAQDPGAAPGDVILDVTIEVK